MGYAIQGVRSGSSLELIGETWHPRRVVPPDARAPFGKGKVRFSLMTKSHTRRSGSKNSKMSISIPGCDALAELGHMLTS